MPAFRLVCIMHMLGPSTCGLAQEDATTPAAGKQSYQSLVRYTSSLYNENFVLRGCRCARCCRMRCRCAPSPTPLTLFMPACAAAPVQAPGAAAAATRPRQR